MMTRLKILLAALALNTPAIAAVAADAPATLAIAIGGIETPKGAVMMGLFDSEEGYKKGAPIRGVRVPVDKANAEALVEGLPAGTYAIKAFHDVDGDGKMSTNPFGMPIEPYAFSNDAKAPAGPASWSEAAFAVKPGDNRITITIK